MSDAPPTPVPTPPPAPVVSETPPTEPAAPEVDYKAEAEKWKALSRKNEDAAKASAEKAKRFDEIEEANKTELQKAQDRAAALETEATTAKLDALRARTATTSGVPEALLHGTTAEELQASADAAIAYAKTQAPGAPPASGGEFGGTGETGQITEEQLKTMKPEEINKALREGRLAHLL